MNKNQPKILALLFFAACLVGFIALANMAYHHHLLFVDLPTARDAPKQVIGPLQNILQIISLPGKTAIAGPSIVVVAVFFWIKSYRREALFTLAVGGVDALSLIIKHVVNRPGPQHIGATVVQSPEVTFPSSHIVHYVAFFGLLVFFMLGLNKLPAKLRVTVSLLSLGLILAIPFARILLAEHWVSDVLGGVLLGITSLIVLIWLYSADWFLPKLKKRFVVND